MRAEDEGVGLPTHSESVVHETRPAVPVRREARAVQQVAPRAKGAFHLEQIVRSATPRRDRVLGVYTRSDLGWPPVETTERNRTGRTGYFLKTCPRVISLAEIYLSSWCL